MAIPAHDQDSDCASAASIIDRLRSDELESLRSEVGRGRRDHILKTLDERGRAQELVRQQYTGRYPFELLQNANDAAGDPGAVGRTVRFVLTDTALLVADQGAGFGTDQIRAICGLGRSSKDPRKSIGYKGLGFKSVGEITDRPQVISSGVRFTFDEDRVRAEISEIAQDVLSGQRVPVYAFPFQLDEVDLGDDREQTEALLSGGSTTVLRLPFKADVGRNKVESHLRSTITPSLLLFLDATDEIHLIGTEADFKAEVAREPHDGYVETLLETSGTTEHWLVFQQRIDVEDRKLTAQLGDIWKEIDQVRVAAAVRLGPDGQPCQGPARPVHVYFPTQEQSGLSIILQADFALELDRRHIAVSPEAAPYNKWLAERLASLLSQVVAPSLAERFPNDAAAVASLAPVCSPTDFGRVISDACITALRRCPFIPCVDGRARRGCETLLLPKTATSPAAVQEVIDLTGLGRLALPDVEANATSRDFVQAALGAEELSLERVLEGLRPPKDGEERAYYELLVSWSEAAGVRRFAALLTPVKCVRTRGGDWSAPDEGLFFPRHRGGVEFPADLRIPIVEIPAIEGLTELLDVAGVGRFEWRSLLQVFVLPRLEDPSLPTEIRSSLLEALRAYYETERTGDPRLKAQIGRVLIPTRSMSLAKRALRPAGEAYLSSTWLGHDRLEQIYGPFAEPEFLDIAPPDDDDRRRSEQGFYEWLGVAAHPRVNRCHTDLRDVYLVHDLSGHPHRDHGELWKSWQDLPAVEEATRCEQGHPSSQQLQTSYSLDRLTAIVDSHDPSRMATLWHELVLAWGSVYESAMAAEFRCQAKNHSGDRQRRAPSLLMHMLRELAWLPCREHGDTVLVKPRRAWRTTRDTPRRIVERVPALDPRLDTPVAVPVATALGVVDAARPAPDDLVTLLNSLAAEHRSRADSSEDTLQVCSAARWAMRTLDSVLAERPELSVETVPLLARQNGQHLFHSTPFVADDPLLAETWEPTLPILDADKDLRSIHKVLGLRILDDDVEIRPVANSPLLDERDKIEHCIEQTKPYLVVLAAKAVPSRHEDVIRGLARLEVQVCEDLILEYQLDNESRQRPEAVSYIAVRQEREGSVRRNIGTAYLELVSDGAEPNWYVFGPQLAQFLGVPTQGDAFAALLGASPADRDQILAARRIPLSAVDEARMDLQQPQNDEVVDELVGSVIEIAHQLPVAVIPDEDSILDPADEVGSEEIATMAKEDPPLQEGAEDLPELDLATISVVDAPSRAELERGRSTGQRKTVGGLGPSGPVDHEARERSQREIGRRGEEVAYHAERVRLERLGWDPDTVVWRSSERPFAPYDIESLDEDGQRIYIEVKATISSDPTDAFEISEAELQYALQKRSSYYIYRVTEAHTATPLVTRYNDPARRIREDRASISLKGARLSFADEPMPARLTTVTPLST